MLAFGGIFLGAAAVFRVSSANEVRMGITHTHTHTHTCDLHSFVPTSSLLRCPYLYNDLVTRKGAACAACNTRRMSSSLHVCVDICCRGGRSRQFGPHFLKVGVTTPRRTILALLLTQRRAPTCVNGGATM